MKEMTIKRQLWGRSCSRPLSNRQQEIYTKGEAELVLSTDKAMCKANPFWTMYSDYILEIGFGDGEHFLEQATLHPHIGFLGCERFINGMAKVMEGVFERNLTNVRLFPDDIHLIKDALPHHVFSKIYVLFPDPWPKKKHKKRRLLNRQFMKECTQLLQPLGTLCMASDIPDYRIFIEEEMRALEDYFTHKDITDAPLTKYGRKALFEGRTSAMLVYQRKSF